MTFIPKFLRIVFFRGFKFLNHRLFSLTGYKLDHDDELIRDLIFAITRNKPTDNIVCSIEGIRKKMIADKSRIVFKDFGAAAPENGVVEKTISEIAKNSPVTARYGRLLYRLAERVNNKYVLELGTSLGISTMYLAAGAGDAAVITIEGAQLIADLAEKNFEESDFKNIKLIRGKFDEVVPGLLEESGAPELVYIDGNHRKKPVLKYFEMIAGKSDEGTVIVIDDINYSQEMDEAWHEIRKSEFAAATFDLYRMGIVVVGCRRTYKEYIIRY